jgi:hypothetical protein
MSLLVILFLLFGLILGGFGTSSSSTTVVPPVKGSKRMPAKAPATQERRCGPPPANP